MISKRLHYNILSLMLLCVVGLAIFYFGTKVTSKAPIAQQEELQTMQEKLEDTSNVLLKKSHVTIDPNTANLQELLEAGFSKKQAYNCLNFVKSGMRFYSVHDIKKLYSMTDVDFEIIRHNISIKSSPQKKEDSKKAVPVYKNKPSVATIKPISLNSADSIELTKIPHIGKFRARKIIEYREKLGGFIVASQLLEIYSFTDTLLPLVEQYIYIDTANLQKININTCTFKELLRHPYMTYYSTKRVFDYLKIVEKIENIQELKQNNILDSIEYRKIYPYLQTF